MHFTVIKGVRKFLLGSLFILFSQSALAQSFTDDAVADKFYKQGTTLMQQGYYKEALAPLGEAIKHDHRFVAAFINRALSRNALKDYQGAIEDAQSALRWNPESSYAWMQKAKAEKSLGQFVEAANDYQFAARYEPGSSYIYNELAATCFESAGQIDKAKQLRVKLLQVSDANSFLARGLYKYKQGQYADALKDLTEAISQDHRLQPAYYNRGLCEAVLGQYKQALTDYGKVIGLTPDYAQAYYLRGWVKFYMSDYAGAAEDFKQHVTINDVGESHSPYSVIMSALAYRKMKRSDAADYMLKWWQQYEYKKWPYPVLRFLRHEATVADVLSAAKTDDLMTEAKAYVGLEYSIEGKTKEAIDNLNWVKKNGNKSFSEYQLALSELAKLAGTR